MFQNWSGVQDVEGQRVKKMIYFDVRSIRIADDELKQQLINKGLAKADDLKGEVVTTALFRRYMEDYLAKREDVNAQMSLPRTSIGGDTGWCPYGTLFLPASERLDSLRAAMADHP